MALQPIQGVTERWKEDADGDMALVIAPGATVAIYNEATGALAPLFAERDGLSGLPNPFASDEYGRFSCYTATGRVKIVVTTAAGEIGLFRNVPLPQLDLSGTWTPVVADASSGGNVASTATAYGTYRRVGDLVFIDVEITDIDTTGLTAGNTLYIQGLPFTSATKTGSPRATAPVQLNFVTGSVGAFAELLDNSSSVFMVANVSASTNNAVIVSDVTSGTADIFFSMVYETGDA